MGKKLFDYVIGNPPYQTQQDNNGRQPPVYNYFMDAADEVADVVELITPARFLFNAGQTPKDWNQKKLSDTHFKVLKYIPDATTVFPNTDIKGGVAVTLQNDAKEYGSIGVFVASDEMNSVLHKVKEKNSLPFSEIVTGAVPYRFTDDVKRDHPDYIDLIPQSFDLRTNVLDRLYNKLFFDNPKGSDDVKIYGLLDKKRRGLWISKKYVSTSARNFDSYKVLLSKANGAGHFGEVLSDPFIIKPFEGHTQSFLSLGKLKTNNEAESLVKYIKTKFFRSMLDILKITQDLTPEKFKYVPLQNFSEKSDINWSKPIHEIDLQLYRKYGLDENEINFIETHVKEMA